METSGFRCFGRPLDEYTCCYFGQSYSFLFFALVSFSLRRWQPVVRLGGSTSFLSLGNKPVVSSEMDNHPLLLCVGPLALFARESLVPGHFDHFCGIKHFSVLTLDTILLNRLIFSLNKLLAQTLTSFETDCGGGIISRSRSRLVTSLEKLKSFFAVTGAKTSSFVSSTSEKVAKCGVSPVVSAELWGLGLKSSFDCFGDNLWITSGYVLVTI